jgi:serine/threonine-protein phosphatase CPPED1
VFAAVLFSSCNGQAAEPNTPSFTFVQLCDPQLGFSNYQQDKAALAQAVVQINELKPDFVAFCGDLVHDADDRSFADFKAAVAKLTVPYYCAPGNHDVGSKPTPESLEKYRRIIGADYFVHNHKNTAFIFINTQLIKETVPGESDRHDAWLRQTLADASAKGRGIFIIGHYPIYLQQPTEPDEYMNLPLQKRAELLSLCDQYNVAAVLGGHAHMLLINKYKDTLLLNAESTSRNLDRRQPGFRLWQVSDSAAPVHRFVPLRTPFEAPAGTGDRQ